MSVGNFDENDVASWYFGSLDFKEAEKLLQKEDMGVFLVRDSSRVPGEYVLCVKERSHVDQFPVHKKTIDDVSHFFLREESTFPGIPSLLCFYKRNRFSTTALIRPIGKDAVPEKPKKYTPKPERLSVSVPQGFPTTSNGSGGRGFQSRVISAPPVMGVRDGCIMLGEDDSNVPVGYAKVVKSRPPNAYDDRWLGLNLDELVQVTKRSASGTWTGIVNGVKGIFPFNFVEIISEEEYMSRLNSQ